MIDDSKKVNLGKIILSALILLGHANRLVNITRKGLISMKI